MSIHNPAIGQRVMYSRQFLNSIGSVEGFDLVKSYGTITDLGSIVGKGKQFVKVLWDGETEKRGALSLNLSLTDKPEL